MTNNITKEMFCDFLMEIVDQYEQRDAIFDQLNGFINFEPFFDTDFYHLAIKGLAMAYDPSRVKDIAETIEWWLDYYFEGHPQDAMVCVEEKEYPLLEVGDLYDYFAMD